jgi:hypothetical protein
MKPQLEPVCGHLRLGNENDVNESGFDVICLENRALFIHATFLYTKCNEEEVFESLSI